MAEEWRSQYDWAAAKKRIFDRLGVDENTDPDDPSTWSDRLKAVHASHYEAVKQDPEFDESEVYADEFLPRTIAGNPPAPTPPTPSPSFASGKSDYERNHTPIREPEDHGYAFPWPSVKCAFCGDIMAGQHFHANHGATENGICKKAAYVDPRSQWAKNIGIDEKFNEMDPSTWSPEVERRAMNALEVNGPVHPETDEPVHTGRDSLTLRNPQYEDGEEEPSREEIIKNGFQYDPATLEYYKNIYQITDAELKGDVSRETSDTPQSVNTAHNVSQQMAGSVSVTPTDAAPAAAPAASGADTTDMSEYWKAIAKDHTTSIRGKGAEAKAARKRLAPYPLFKHFDDLVAAKKALEIPTDKLGPKGQGTVGESVPAGAQFATISPGDSDEYAARATRHNELVKAIADVSIHFGDLYGKQAPMPTTLHPDHDHSALLEPVKDSSGIVHLKSDISGPLDYGVVNEYRFGKGTFGYEMKPMDSPISPMTMADKTSSGLGASQKRAPAKKVSTGVSKFATPDNNPSPSYKVKTNFQSFEPTDYRNNKKTQAFVLANKKAFLISKMNEVHPLPTEEERARMSSAQHQSVVDQVFKNRTAWLNKSMKGNIDDMIPKDNS